MIRERMRTASLLVLGLAILLTLPNTVRATNGMYLAGYGSEAGGRGGANIAVSDRALGLQANPAGIAQLQGNHFSVEMQVLMPELNYSGDFFGNTISGGDQSFFMPQFSYVRGGKDTGWTWGIGLVSQGGMGADYRGYNTPFGTVDNTFSEVRFATVTPTVAYSFTDDLSLGLTAKLGFSDVTYKFWPRTSFEPGTPMDPSDDFYGNRLEERATAFNYSLRVGLMWRAHPKWQLGFVYQTETEGDYEDGELVLDTRALLPNTTTYRKAEVDNFTWPEEYGIGIQFRPAEKWILALDVKEYKWSDAVTLVTVSGSRPDNMFVPPTADLPFPLNWEDQTVVAFGLEHRLDPAWTLRAGYNHGDSPVPDETLNPLFPAIVEDHATVGFGYTWGGNTINFALERGFEGSQTNSNTNPAVDPFSGSTIDHSQWTISVGYSKAFSRK